MGLQLTTQEESAQENCIRHNKCASHQASCLECVCHACVHVMSALVNMYMYVHVCVPSCPEVTLCKYSTATQETTFDPTSMHHQ